MSEGLKVITNNVPREIIEAYQLTEDERKEFEYINWSAIDEGTDSASFVRYKGELHDLGDTEGTFPADGRWFYKSDSFFSGVLFRYASVDYSYIVCGWYYYS